MPQKRKFKFPKFTGGACPQTSLGDQNTCSGKRAPLKDLAKHRSPLKHMNVKQLGSRRNSEGELQKLTTIATSDIVQKGSKQSMLLYLVC